MILWIWIHISIEKKFSMIYWILLPKAEEGFIELNQCQVNSSWLEVTYYIYPCKVKPRPKAHAHNSAGIAEVADFFLRKGGFILISIGNKYIHEVLLTYSYSITIVSNPPNLGGKKITSNIKVCNNRLVSLLILLISDCNKSRFLLEWAERTSCTNLWTPDNMLAWSDSCRVEKKSDFMKIALSWAQSMTIKSW